MVEIRSPQKLLDTFFIKSYVTTWKITGNGLKSSAQVRCTRIRSNFDNLEFVVASKCGIFASLSQNILTIVEENSKFQLFEMLQNRLLRKFFTEYLHHCRKKDLLISVK